MNTVIDISDNFHVFKLSPGALREFYHLLQVTLRRLRLQINKKVKVNLMNFHVPNRLNGYP